MYTKRIQLINYGPIDRLDIVCPFDGDKPKPIIFVGENGSGKSVLLSHIVNGMLLAQQVAYPDTPEVAAGKVYKLRSPLYIKSGRDFSFTQVEFEDTIRFDELQLAKPRQDYATAPSGIQETDAHDLWNRMDHAETSIISPNFEAQRIKKLFERNCILYFPSNRFEDPAWLNEQNLKARAQHMIPRHRKGSTERTVINYSSLRDNENWLFDVTYDFSVFEQQTKNIVLKGSDKSKLNVPLSIFAGFSGHAKTLYDIALKVVQTVIQGPGVRLAIGTRKHRVISVMDNEQTRVPNLFQLSSGEVSLLDIFLSILRDFDSCEMPLAKPEDVRGIAVVDEIDLHLHAVHQYEILPKLIRMFPRVQFVLTTHSPLFVLGLQKILKDSGFVLYRLPHGQQTAPEDFSEFGDAYHMFKQTNAYLSEMKAVVQRTEKPLIFVDGKTDVKYLKRAAELLGWSETLANPEIREGGGDGNLKNAWKTFTAMTVVRQTVVLLHDCESRASSCNSGNIFRRRVPLVENHPICTGIENLFSKETLEKAIQHKPEFIDIVAKHEVTERGHRKVIDEQWKVNEDEKSNLCDWLCENSTTDDFRCFDRIYDELRQIPGVLSRSAADERV